MMKTVLILLIFLSASVGFSQGNVPKDKITLKDSSEHIGYIIEQVPGKEIKLYDPLKLDTIVIKMNNVLRLNKMFDEKQLRSKD